MTQKEKEKKINKPNDKNLNVFAPNITTIRLIREVEFSI